MSSAAARYLFLHSQVSNLFDLNIVEIRIVARTPDARAPDDYMYMDMYMYTCTVKFAHARRGQSLEQARRATAALAAAIAPTTGV